MKSVRYFFEAAGLYILLFIFRLMPAKTASDCGGAIGSFIGPRLAASRKAAKNISSAFPDTPPEKIRDFVRGMWGNLGRVIAEYPHMKKITGENVIIKGQDILERHIKKGQPCMLIGVHQANWEITAYALLRNLGITMDFTYRAPNNPWTDRLLMKMRSDGGNLRGYSKSSEGGRAMMKAMDEGRTIGILIDQKYNEGIAVPFFGKPAMTNPVFVKLAQKYKYPLIPVQIERVRHADFIITFHDEIDIFDTQGHKLPVETVMEKAHEVMERCIRSRPEQWLWLHRRWDSKQLKDVKEAA